MKRKVVSFLLATALCASLSMTALAGSSSQGGRTSGGYSGSLTTSASLSVTESSATARTTAGSSAGVNLYTSVIYYYINAASQQLATSAAGSGSATATNSYRSGSYATSAHRVTSVSDRWGSWSCGLSAYR